MPIALILGATGLVGGELLTRLLDDDWFTSVRVIARRPTGVRHPRLDEHVLELEAMGERPELFAVDQIFCALGTTIRKAGSQEQFRRVDYEYPLTVAKLGLAAGARHYLLVSSLGADPGSRVFYSRVKGELEREVLALGYPAVTIARPSLLTGERTELRLGERIAQAFGWAMPSSYRPIAAATVARALLESARSVESGMRILQSSDMRAQFER